MARKLELEVDTLRREREVLISRITDLETENASTHGRVSQLEGEIFRLTSSTSGTNSSSGGSSETKKAAVIEKKESESAAGIIHSVHIRTGGGDEGIRRTTRDQYYKTFFAATTQVVVNHLVTSVTKFCHFGGILKVLGKFLRLYFLSDKHTLYFAKGQIFNASKGQILKNSLAILSPRRLPTWS